MEKKSEQVEEDFQQLQISKSPDETEHLLESISSQSLEQMDLEKDSKSNTTELTLPKDSKSFAGEVELTPTLDPEFPAGMEKLPSFGRTESESGSKCQFNLETSDKNEFRKQTEFIDSLKSENVISEKSKSTEKVIEPEILPKLENVSDESKESLLVEMPPKEESVESESDDKISFKSTPKQFFESKYTCKEQSIDKSSDYSFIIPRMSLSPKSKRSLKVEQMNEEIEPSPASVTGKTAAEFKSPAESTNIEESKDSVQSILEVDSKSSTTAEEQESVDPRCTLKREITSTVIAEDSNVVQILDRHSENQTIDEKVEHRYKKQSIEDEAMSELRTEQKNLKEEQVDQHHFEDYNLKSVIESHSEKESSRKEAVPKSNPEQDSTQSEIELGAYSEQEKLKEAMPEGSAEQKGTESEAASEVPSEQEKSKGAVPDTYYELERSKDEEFSELQSEPENSGEELLECQSETESSRDGLLSSQEYETADEGAVQEHHSEPKSLEEKSALVRLSELESAEDAVTVSHSDAMRSKTDIVLGNLREPVKAEESDTTKSDFEQGNMEKEQFSQNESDKGLASKSETEFKFSVQKEPSTVEQDDMLKTDSTRQVENDLSEKNDSGQLKLSFQSGKKQVKVELNLQSAKERLVTKKESEPSAVKLEKDLITELEVETLSGKELSLKYSSLLEKTERQEKTEYACPTPKKRNSEESELELQLGRKRTMEGSKLDYLSRQESIDKGPETKSPTKTELKRLPGELIIGIKSFISSEKAGSKEKIVTPHISKMSKQFLVPENIKKEGSGQSLKVLKKEPKYPLSEGEYVIETKFGLPYKKRSIFRPSFSPTPESSRREDSSFSIPIENQSKETGLDIVPDNDSILVEQQTPKTMKHKLSSKIEDFEKPTEHESSKVVLPHFEHIAAINLAEAKMSLRKLTASQFPVAEYTKLKSSEETLETEQGSPTPGPSRLRTPSPKNKNSEDEITSRFLELENSDSSNGTQELPWHITSDPSYVAEVVQNQYNGFVHISYDQKIRECDVIDLLKRMRVNHYAAMKSEEDLIYGICKGLYEKDYICEIIDNSGGALSVNYPVRLLIPVKGKLSDEESSGRPFDPAAYKAQVKSCHTSRCRTRFVTPVILWNKKFICRSGTLSVRKSAVYETVTKPKEMTVQPIPVGIFHRAFLTARNFISGAVHRTVCLMQGSRQLLEIDSVEREREEDKEILESLSIKYICDLMVEDRKIVKQIRVSSSEKINRSIYADFYVEQIPYPGCEFFERYRRANRMPEGLIFNWNRSDVNAVLKLTKQEFRIPNLPWSNYKEWDAVQLTQNYIALILTYLVKGQGGLLVHCISGWDRTPLFISLIRISLWADGVIHQSLSPMDMIYLTLAYDWYLFGHNLPARLKKGEEIMHFCFKFLPYIADEKYSVRNIYRSQEKGLEKTEGLERARRINFISEYVLNLYDEYIMPPVA